MIVRGSVPKPIPVCRRTVEPCTGTGGRTGGSAGLLTCFDSIFVPSRRMYAGGTLGSGWCCGPGPDGFERRSGSRSETTTRRTKDQRSSAPSWAAAGRSSMPHTSKLLRLLESKPLRHRAGIRSQLAPIHIVKMLRCALLLALAAGSAAFAPSPTAKLALQRSHTTPLANIRMLDKAALDKRAADAVIAYDKAEAKAAKVREGIAKKAAAAKAKIDAKLAMEAKKAAAAKAAADKKAAAAAAAAAKKQAAAEAAAKKKWLAKQDSPSYGGKARSTPRPAAARAAPAKKSSGGSFFDFLQPKRR